MRINRVDQKKDFWPSWRYGPSGEAEIFQSEDEVPNGWTRKPNEPNPEEVALAVEPIYHDREAIIQELLDRGIPFEYAHATSYLKELL